MRFVIALYNNCSSAITVLAMSIRLYHWCTARSIKSQSPCGTPELTAVLSLMSPSQYTLLFLSVSQTLTHFRSQPQNNQKSVYFKTSMCLQSMCSNVLQVIDVNSTGLLLTAWFLPPPPLSFSSVPSWLKRIWCGIVSNTLDKSSNSMSTCSLLSIVIQQLTQWCPLVVSSMTSIS